MPYILFTRSIYKECHQHLIKVFYEGLGFFIVAGMSDSDDELQEKHFKIVLLGDPQTGVVSVVLPLKPAAFITAFNL